MLKVLLIPLTLLLPGGLFLATDNGLGEPGRDQSQSAAFPGKPGQIAFARDGKRRGIYVADPSGNNVRRITRGNDTGPDWSPDGRQIAFTRGSDGKTSIYVVDADGSGLRRVLKDPAPASEDPTSEVPFPAWSPDGAQLAFEYEDGVGVVNLDGTGARPLLSEREDFIEPAWSPDGKTIAIGTAIAPEVISVVDVTGGQKRLVTRDCGRSPDWSPDNRRIVCWRLSLGKGNALYVVDVATGAARRLTRKAALTRASYGPSWSPDGRRIVFGKIKVKRLTSRTLKSDIYVMNSDGTRKHRVIRNGALPDWGRQP